jgi:hypothetical protein
MIAQSKKQVLGQFNVVLFVRLHYVASAVMEKKRPRNKKPAAMLSSAAAGRLEIQLYNETT